MVQKEAKRSLRELSPLDVYKLLPKITPPCAECGEKNCLAFAVKVVNREVALEICTPLLKEKYKNEYADLRELLAPPIREVTVGVEPHSIKIGGKLVMYRHEFTYHNPAPIAIDVSDHMSEEEILERVKLVESFRYNYIGRILSLDMIAIRSTSNDPARFKTVVTKIAEATNLPLILCSLNPEVMQAALETVYSRRPLIYAATKENWREMCELAAMYNCPLVIFASHDIGLLRSLANTVMKYGIENIALDPGTSAEKGLSQTIANFTMIRRNACKGGDNLLGFPLIGVPMTAWLEKETPPEVLQWRESCLASLLMTRYADLLIMHSMQGWALLPNVVWRFNLYSDPSKPVAVDSGLKLFGEPDEKSPVMFTTNYALTYFTVESDIKSSDIDCYLIVVDTEGLSVESSVAGRILTAQVVADALRNSAVESKVQHKHLVIPGLAARLSGEIEEITGWQVLVGPKDSSGIPQFLQKNWPPKKAESG